MPPRGHAFVVFVPVASSKAPSLSTSHAYAATEPSGSADWDASNVTTSPVWGAALSACTAATGARLVVVTVFVAMAPAPSTS